MEKIKKELVNTLEKLKIFLNKNDTINVKGKEKNE